MALDDVSVVLMSWFCLVQALLLLMDAAMELERCPLLPTEEQC
jgi:hypothetical protein